MKKIMPFLILIVFATVIFLMIDKSSQNDIGVVSDVNVLSDSKPQNLVATSTETQSANRFVINNTSLSFKIPEGWIVEKKENNESVLLSSDFILDTSFPDRVVKQGVSLTVTTDNTFDSFTQTLRTANNVYNFEKDLSKNCDCLEVKEMNIGNLELLYIRARLPEDLFGSPEGETIIVSFVQGDHLVKLLFEYKKYNDDIIKVVDGVLSTLE